MLESCVTSPFSLIFSSSCQAGISICACAFREGRSEVEGGRAVCEESRKGGFVRRRERTILPTGFSPFFAFNVSIMGMCAGMGNGTHWRFWMRMNESTIVFGSRSCRSEVVKLKLARGRRELLVGGPCQEGVYWGCSSPAPLASLVPRYQSFPNPNPTPVRPAGSIFPSLPPPKPPEPYTP